MPGQSQMESRTRGGSILDSWLEPNWKSLRSLNHNQFLPVLVLQQQCGYLDMSIRFSYICVYRVDIMSSVMVMVHTKKSWCVESWNLMPLATDIYSGNIFQLTKLEESMVGEDSKPEETSSELAGTHFTTGKRKFRWKFWSSKGLESDYLRNSTEFRMDFPTKSVNAGTVSKQDLFLWLPIESSAVFSTTQSSKQYLLESLATLEKSVSGNIARKILARSRDCIAIPWTLVVGPTKVLWQSPYSSHPPEESTINYPPLFAPPTKSGQVAQIPALSSSGFVGWHWRMCPRFG